MRRSGLELAILAALSAGPAALHAYSAEDLYRSWPVTRFVTTAAPCLGPEALQERIAALAARRSEIRVEPLGQSAQGRPIRLLRLGHGTRRVLLWSQMHGDEPSATPALLDLAEYLVAQAADPDAARVLDELELLMVPMLNPDGAAAYTRENAQAIDINRDALSLATPEGGILKALRDRFEPVLGFNLHDQNRRRTAGQVGILATNAVLAVAGDEAQTWTPQRQRAQRACVAIADALGRFAPGGLGRWDDEFNPRAFGDNLTAWGTPVVLLESGAIPAGRPFEELTRLDFVAILMALRDLARDDLAEWDAARYQDIPDNALGDWLDIVVRNGEIRQPGSPAPYRADLPFDVLRRDQDLAGCPGSWQSRSKIGEIGDGRLFFAGRTIDASGRWILAPFVAGADGWRARRWLSADALSRLARLGVAELRWRVPARRFAAAESIAHALAGPRRARLSVAVEPLPADLVRLDHPPEIPPLRDLANVLDALGTRTTGTVDTVLTRLWNAGAEGEPRLAPERPASFLVFDPETGLDGRIESVWIDGLEIEADREGSAQ